MTEDQGIGVLMLLAMIAAAAIIYLPAIAHALETLAGIR